MWNIFSLKINIYFMARYVNYCEVFNKDFNQKSSFPQLEVFVNTEGKVLSNKTILHSQLSFHTSSLNELF